MSRAYKVYESTQPTCSVDFKAIEISKLKAQRDTLLAAAKAAQLCARIEIIAGNKAWKEPAEMLRQAIDACAAKEQP